MLLHAPTPLVLADLTDLTRRVAAQVRAGRHPVHIDPAKRWYQLLRSDDFVDVWLMSWATEQAAELHDHAGSLGALTRSGRLAEHVDGRGCTPALRQAAARAARISVHAYSPPLSAMSYYAVASDGHLRRTRSELVAAP